MTNKIADPIDYIYNFTKSNIQGPRNLPKTMLKDDDGNLEEVLTCSSPTYEYQVGILWPHRVFKNEEEHEEDGFNKGDKDEKSDKNSKPIINQRIKTSKIEVFLRLIISILNTNLYKIKSNIYILLGKIKRYMQGIFIDHK